jgi:thiol-disulfide isomerase/thioredoxin
MAETPSTMLPLGTMLPSFRLFDTDGELLGSDQLAGTAALVVAFICPHCPFVRHIRHALGEFGRSYQGKDVRIVAINSNDTGAYPQDGLEGMAREAAEGGYTFPYLFDETQETAKAFQAACTPDFFVFDRDGRLAYRGQFDSSRPGNGKPVTGADLRAAVDALLAGREVDQRQIPSIGCNIKWRRGQEPGYHQPKR